MLNVKLFAKASQLAGGASVEIPWTDGGTVLHLKHALADRHPGLRPLIPLLLVAVNNEYATDDRSIRSADEVACFPPVSGG
jgi:molybdopterin synthase sulfur carrier subunit